MALCEEEFPPKRGSRLVSVRANPGLCSVLLKVRMYRTVAVSRRLKISDSERPHRENAPVLQHVRDVTNGVSEDRYTSPWLTIASLSYRERPTRHTLSNITVCLGPCLSDWSTEISVPSSSYRSGLNFNILEYDRSHRCRRGGCAEPV